MGKGRLPFGTERFGRRPEIRPIARPGLLARLDAAGAPVLLAAGTGAGKSTLLDAWVAAHEGVLLDAAEGEWGGVGGARVVGVDGAAAGDAGEIHELVRRGCRVVVAAEGEVAVEGAVRVGAGELGFAEDETYQVLGGALGDAEGADELAPDLHLLTHGWPALVALAGVWLAMFPGSERRQRLRALAYAEGGIQEFLVPAVLDGLGGEEREIVRRLAWLPGVDAELADRLDVTEDLRAVPPFVQPLARRAGWYAVPDGWKGVLRRELPLSAAEVAALRKAAYAAGM